MFLNLFLMLALLVEYTFLTTFYGLFFNRQFFTHNIIQFFKLFLNLMHFIPGSLPNQAGSSSAPPPASWPRSTLAKAASTTFKPCTSTTGSTDPSTTSSTITPCPCRNLYEASLILNENQDLAKVQFPPEMTSWFRLPCSARPATASTRCAPWRTPCLNGAQLATGLSGRTKVHTPTRQATFSTDTPTSPTRCTAPSDIIFIWKRKDENG